MNTQQAIKEYIEYCQKDGKTSGTIATYSSHLKHFELAFPDGLPWEWPKIDRFLKQTVKKKEARAKIKKTLGTFYSFLEHQGYGQNPIPRGKAGRPRKEKPPRSGLSPDKLVRGGQTSLSEPTSTSISTSQAVEAFLNAKGALRPHTIRWYRDLLTRFALEFPTLPLQPEPIERYLFAMTGTPERRHGHYRALKAFYNFLKKRRQLPVDPQWGVINPIDQVELRNPPQKVPASLDMTELQTVIDACQTPKEQALVALIADCGLRAGEIVSLTRENIGDEFAIVQGKTGERQVSISPNIRDILLSLVPSDPIFLNRVGKPLTESGIYQTIRAIMDRAGIKKRHLGPHMLRHTFGRQFIAGGGDLVTAQKELGHHNITTTRIYTELAAEDVRKRHQESSPLKSLDLNFQQQRATCYGCGKELVLNVEKVKEFECPDCHQVGKWYLPNHRAEEPNGNNDLRLDQEG